MPFQHDMPIMFGDCDPFGIVFYPNYFRWMDNTFHMMCAAAGFSQTDLPAHGIKGTPLRDVGAEFHSPARAGDTLTISAEIAEFTRSSLKVAYRLSIGERLVATGHELRIFVKEKDGGIASARAPEPIREMLAPYTA
ncbi:acyl-CoA thioesterase [Mesobacterium pallidum]|uniref:acyl-CoA thioesterase n=1 Tax=Mesobacterium pallidum TaxID=2872037 RepID=UPI001EE1A599|nr:thioesterase family protein [Mesobacterium pallidum]